MLTFFERLIYSQAIFWVTLYHFRLCWSLWWISCKNTVFSKSAHLSMCGYWACCCVVSIAVPQRWLLGSCERLGLGIRAWRWHGIRGIGGRITRIKESERQMEAEQTQSQEESQEVAKSRSPGSGKFQGWGSTETVRSWKFALGWMTIPETFDRSTGGSQCSQWVSDPWPGHDGT